MGFMLFHHVPVLEFMPHCDYVCSQLSSTSPHSLRQPLQTREHNTTSKSVRTATWSMADFLSSTGLLASMQVQA